MKNFLKEHGLWILFTAAVISVMLAVMSTFTTTSPFLVNVANTVTSPFRTAYTTVVNWFNEKQNYYRDITLLEAENAELRQRLAQLESDIRQARDDSAENKLLRDLLNLREKRKDFVFESADITEHSVTNWSSTLTLNKGTLHGVEVNDCVIDATGALVGTIQQVGLNWATVLTLVDSDTSMGAQVFRTKDLGLAQGNFSLMGENLLRLDYLPAECELLGGDLVETSGLGGYYPSGLIIGTIERVQRDDSGSASYAILTPSVEFSDLTEVFVIKEFDVVP